MNEESFSMDELMAYSGGRLRPDLPECPIIAKCMLYAGHPGAHMPEGSLMLAKHMFTPPWERARSK